MKDYAEHVARELENLGYEIALTTCEKANGVVYSGVRIETGLGMCPIFYTEDFEGKGYTADDAAKMIAEMYEKQFKQNCEDNKDVAAFYTDYEKVKENLSLRLYNKSTNAEVYKSAKRYGFDDLILVPVVDVKLSNEENGSIRVLESHLEKWGVDKNTVFRDAMKNTKEQKVSIQSLQSFISEIVGWDDDECFGTQLDDILIVSNEKRVFGASTILGALKGLKKASANGFYVIPSSVHEVLVVPKHIMPKEAIDDMVSQVNATTVVPEEVLSDHAYAF